VKALPEVCKKRDEVNEQENALTDEKPCRFIHNAA
jgi:hypothetical protein